jgi:deoxycytidylate deaminase
MLEASVEGIQELREPRSSELIIGLVGAVGTDLAFLSRVLEEQLKQVGFSSTTIQLSKALQELPPWKGLPESPEDDRIRGHMDAGDNLRGMLGRGDALALIAIARMRAERLEVAGDDNRTLPRHAYILRSLKHPEEVDTLREIYGSAFILVAGYSPREKRLEELARAIARSRQDFRAESYRSNAEELIYRDHSDEGNSFGQNVRSTFPMADCFVDVSHRQELPIQIQRFLELVFGHPFHTPSKDEYAMFHAKAAALRSSDLGRQVGAVVATEDGDIVSVGSNEVPKAGGGLYWAGDENDGRSFTLGHDPSDRFKEMALADILHRLKDAGWLINEKASLEIDTLVRQALSTDGGKGPAIGAHLMNAIEYGRAVHAEMAAITDAARRGVQVRGCAIYTTTFPCHDCAKHIVASGISRVIYIEPYAKSLASELYPDSTSVDNPEEALGRVHFEPFVGVAPQRYFDLFEMVPRKQRDGRVVTWSGVDALPRLSESSLVYLARETSELASFEKELAAKGLRDKQD